MRQILQDHGETGEFGRGTHEFFRCGSAWADFWDTKAFPGSRSLQSVDADRPELEFVLLADGVPLDKLYPLDVDRAFKSLDRIKGSVKKFWDTGALPGVLLGREEVVMSSVWHGRLDDLIKQGSPLAYQWNGARRQSNGWGIPKGTGNLDAAYQLIDFGLRPEVQAHYASIYPMAPSVPAACKKLSAAAASNPAGSPGHLHSGFDLVAGREVSDGQHRQPLCSRRLQVGHWALASPTGGVGALP